MSHALSWYLKSSIVCAVIKCFRFSLMNIEISRGFIEPTLFLYLLWLIKAITGIDANDERGSLNMNGSFRLPSSPSVNWIVFVKQNWQVLHLQKKSTNHSGLPVDNWDEQQGAFICNIKKTRRGLVGCGIQRRLMPAFDYVTSTHTGILSAAPVKWCLLSWWQYVSLALHILWLPRCLPALAPPLPPPLNAYPLAHSLLPLTWQEINRWNKCEVIAEAQASRGRLAIVQEGSWDCCWGGGVGLKVQGGERLNVSLQ